MSKMVKEGTVVENKNGNLLIQIEKNEACGACASKGNCGQKEKAYIEVFSEDNFNKGDNVFLETDSADITKYGIYVYIFPVFMLLIGAILPNILLKNSSFDMNLLTLGSMAIFLVISFVIIKAIDRSLKDKKVMKIRRA